MLAFPSFRLKEILLKEGVIDSAKFDILADEASRKNQQVADLLIAQGFLTKEFLLSLIAKTLGVPRVNFNTETIDEAILRALPEDIARQKRTIIFGKESDGRLKVAMEDPTDLETIDFLSLRLGATMEPFLASEEDLHRGFSLYEQRLTEDFKTLIEKSVQDSLRLKSKGDLREAAQDLPIVALLDNLLAFAVSSRASDIHFEALEDMILVRERVDGILREVLRIPREVHAPLVARIKILSGLRVDEHSNPQDGRFRYQGAGERTVDIRVSIIPTHYGEKVELRVFASSEKPLSLTELGFLEDQAILVKEAISKTYGMILVSGPTGSGKTTTLYSLMNMLNRPEVNIVSIEDPIEYDMRYVNQVQVNPAAGITFASGLRSILRQDPNVIMVGEIRDEETASIAVQAALTGHLVLSSLHTNDAPTAVPRFIDMHVQPFLVSAVLNEIIAQRLVRKIHLECVESYVPSPELKTNIKKQLFDLGIKSDVKLSETFYRGKGCSACNHTGFLGRVGIFEILRVSEGMRKFIMSDSFSLDGLRTRAREEGMISMFEDGLKKVERGITTVEEVFRVIRE